MEGRKIFIIVAFFLCLFSIILLIRVFRGPTTVDRIMAADAIDILMGVISIIVGIMEDNSIYIDLGLVIALLGFIGTLFICRYLDGEV